MHPECKLSALIPVNSCEVSLEPVKIQTRIDRHVDNVNCNPKHTW